MRKVNNRRVAVANAMLYGIMGSMFGNSWHGPRIVVNQPSDDKAVVIADNKILLAHQASHADRVQAAQAKRKRKIEAKRAYRKGK